jgi:hypothetical protein
MNKNKKVDPKLDWAIKTIQTMKESSDVITASQAKQFIELLLSGTKQQKDELVNSFDKFSTESYAKIQEAVSMVSQKHSDALLEVRQLTNKQRKEHEDRISELQNILAEIKAIEVKDGENGKDAEVDYEKIIGSVLEQIPETVEETPEQVASKLNTLDEAIDQRVIKGLTKKISDLSSNIAHSAVERGAKLYTGTSETRVREIIAETPVSSSGGGTWGSITGTLSDQTDLQSALDALVPYTGATADLNLGTWDILTDTAKASTSAGLALQSSAGTVTALFGAGGGANSTFYGGSKFDYATVSTVPYFDASKNLISSAVTPTELGYLSGVTSAIQTQFTGKLSLTGGTMTGNILFTDNTYDIGASGATRPRTGYFGTSIITGTTSSAGTVSLYESTGTLNSITTSASGGIVLSRGGTNGTWFYPGDGRMQMRSDGYVGWTSSTNPVGSADTSLSRISAGVVGVGTGTAGSIAGQLQVGLGIVLGGVPTLADDKNVIYSNSSNTTLGFVAGASRVAHGSTGACFVGRGNTYSAIANQRGTMYFIAGTPTSPTTGEGQISFYTGATVHRMTIGKTGNVTIGSTTETALFNVGTAAQFQVSTTGAITGTGLALGANSITMTGSLAATGARVTKGWFTNIESTNMPTVGGTAILTSLTAPQFTTIELGHATDTTLARVSAGVASIEGARIITSTGTTSGTILKNNGTTFVASTETYAAPGTSGNVMTSDGTNWTSAAPASGSSTAVDSAQSVYSNHVIVFTGSGATPTGDTWSVDGTLGAGTKWDGNMIRMTSGTNTSITQFLPGNIGASSSFFQFGNTKDITISFNAKFSSVTGQVGVGVADDTGVFYSVATSAGKIVFTWNGTTLNAVNGEAGTNTTTDISSGLTLTNWNSFKIVYTYGTDVKFYVNNTLKATHTTNLPTSSNNSRFGMGAATTGKTYEVSNVVVSIEK